MYTIICIIDNRQGPTVYIIGNYIQFLVVIYNGKEYEKEIYIYIYRENYITESLCCIPETNTAL